MLPKTGLYVYNKTAFARSLVMLEWLYECFLTWKKERYDDKWVLPLLDRLASHRYEGFAKKCLEDKNKCEYGPPNMTNIWQPADGPITGLWSASTTNT